MNIRPEAGEYAYKIKTIDSHTMGEATRIVYDGFPTLKGDTMMEKKKDLMEHYDFLREALMLEPRGHRDMFGALLTEPVHEEAAVGVIFLDSGGCLNMCGHGSIGTASMLVETGMVPVKEPFTDVVLDAPSGIIRTRVHVVDHKAVEVSILNVPSFLYRENVQVETDSWGTVICDIAFGGSFFALVDAEKLGLSLEMTNIDEITALGMEIREKINETQDIRHPYLDITAVDLVEFYSHTDNPAADMKNCVIFGDGQADRSPCGTGTSAKLATLVAKKELALGEEFVYESITGSLFKGVATQEIEIGSGKGIIPQITGSAYITGLNEWIIDEGDPLKYGFLLGKQKTEITESTRTKIIQAAWTLFYEKGYDKTTVEEISHRAGVSEKEFRSYFQHKDELEHTLGELFDQKYEQLMVSMNPRLTQYEKLVYLNKELFALIEKQVPFELVSHIYMSRSGEQKELLDSNRFYYKLIKQIISEGQKTGEFSSEETADTLAENYESLERGIIYDWCVRNGATSLIAKGQSIIPMYLKHVV